MNIGATQARDVVIAAKSMLGKRYAPDFRCVDFVRAVYEKIGITIPKILNMAPPKDFNIEARQLSHPPIGHIMFLRDRFDTRKHRIWTHVVIIIEGDACIHCSIFYGQKVVKTPLELLYKRYDFVPSIETHSRKTTH